MALHAEDSVAAARDLYTAANYEDALVVLSRLDSPSSQPSDRMAINQYRAFCLLALGRMAEAERAIEAVLIGRPSVSPGRRRHVAAAAGGICRRAARILPRSCNRNTRARRRRSTVRIRGGDREFDRVLRALGGPRPRGCGREPALRRPSHAGQRVPRFERQGGDPAAAPAAARAAAGACSRGAPNGIYGGLETGVMPPVVVRQTLPAFLLISFRATTTASWKS